MKLSRHAFVTFWDVHAWGGVLVSLVAYAMFVGGTFSVFYGPLRAWQDPPEGAADRARNDAAVVRAAADHGLAGKWLDVWLKPYDRSAGQAAAMKDYLAWEVDLVGRIERDGTCSFHPLTR